MGLIDVDKEKAKTSKKSISFPEGEPVRTTILMNKNKRDALKIIAVKKNMTFTALLDEAFDYLLNKYL